MRSICVVLALVFLLPLFDVSGAIGDAVPSREEVCKDVRWNYECAQRIESLWISRLTGRVRRDGATLALSLDNGGTLSRKDSAKPGHFGSYDQAFTLSNCFPDEKFYLVEVHYFEGHSFQLINTATGASTRVDGEPVFSPDRRRFFVLFQNPYGDRDQRVEVWKTHPLKKEWTHEFVDTLPLVIRWSDSSVIDLHARAGSFDEGYNPGWLIARFNVMWGAWALSPAPR
jgi:hypothetical protein